MRVVTSYSDGRCDVSYPWFTLTRNRTDSGRTWDPPSDPAGSSTAEDKVSDVRTLDCPLYGRHTHSYLVRHPLSRLPPCVRPSGLYPPTLHPVGTGSLEDRPQVLFPGVSGVRRTKKFERTTPSGSPPASRYQFGPRGPWTLTCRLLSRGWRSSRVPGRSRGTTTQVGPGTCSGNGGSQRGGLLQPEGKCGFDPTIRWEVPCHLESIPAPV